MTTYTCPVCGFTGLDDPPRSVNGHPSYEICSSCGFEFGVDDDDRHITYEQWRARWVQDGMRWWAGAADPPPAGWDPVAQLRTAGLDEA